MENVSASTSAHSSEIIELEQPRDGLSEYSPKDAPWDVHRGQSDDVGGIYATAAEFERYASRMADCGGVLRFGWSTAPETGETALRLREAHFCRVRHCPVCQWRRSLMWQARFHQSLPKIVQEHPKARWVFLTLTVRNCSIGELGEMLTAMNAGWQRLIKRKEFRPVSGWVRTTEVTRGADGSAHPHFHALLMVPPSMLAGSNYVKQARWVELWTDCMRLDYVPVVDVRAVKATIPEGAKPSLDAMGFALQRAVAETLKYSVKPGDMTDDPYWFLELTRQAHKRRFVATGGVLKNVLRVDEETDADLVMADGSAEGEDDGSRLAFNWRETERRYRRAPNGDKPAR
jgi:plasmid rolling circle replication initiator protein Rep